MFKSTFNNIITGGEPDSSYAGALAIYYYVLRETKFANTYVEIMKMITI